MVGVLMMKDAGGATVIKCLNARIKKPADVKRGNELHDQTWELMCGNLEMAVGGNPTATFDFALYAVTFNGIPIVQFKEGTSIEVTRSADDWKMEIGVLGEAGWSRQYNKSGDVKFTLMQTSPSNDVLSAFQLVDGIPGM